MKASLETQKQGSGQTQRIVILLAGIGLFALLFFAEKDNLNNQPGRTLSAPPTTTVGEGGEKLKSSTSLEALPPLAADEVLDGWVQSPLPKYGK